MEISSNEENIKQQPTDDNRHNIETVTPDIENVHPLSRQGNPEEIAATTAKSSDSKPDMDHTTQQEANKKEAEEENNTNPQDNNHESVQVKDKSDNQETAEPEDENASTLAEQIDESPQNGNNIISENKSDDPGDDIETVSP